MGVRGSLSFDERFEESGKAKGEGWRWWRKNILGKALEVGVCLVRWRSSVRLV